MNWISVLDELPAPKAMCLVVCNDGIEISYFTPNGQFAIDVLYKSNVTHWMKLPDMPEK